MTVEKKKRNVVAGSSLGLGAAIAVVMSWTANKAIGWAVFHGILGWVYVVYYLFTHHDWTWF